MQNEAMDMGVGDSVQAQVLSGRIQEALKAANGTRHESDIPKVKKAASLSGGDGSPFQLDVIGWGQREEVEGSIKLLEVWRGQLEDVE